MPISLPKLGRELVTSVDSNAQANTLREGILARNVDSSIGAVLRIIEQGRRNCTALGVINGDDYPDTDPAYALGKLQRIIYQQSSLELLHYPVTRERIGQLHDVHMYDDPSWQRDIATCTEELTAVRDHLNTYFTKFSAAVPIVQMSRSKLHMALELSHTANGMPGITGADKGLLYDVSRRVVHVAYDDDDLVSPLTFDDIKMIAKGYASWALQAARDGRIPPDPAAVQEYGRRVYLLYKDERRDERDLLFDSGDVSTVIPKEDGTM